jgi:hypothetical protein
MLDKNIWTEADFENMTCHDNPIHAITFTDNFELVLDIDYIFEWILIGNKYVFRISPCTWIFENVYELIFDIGPTIPGLTIDYVNKDNPKRPKNFEHINRDIEFDWTIATQEGTISFKSVGFKQYIRVVPKIFETQKLTLEERGGISFATTTY